MQTEAPKQTRFTHQVVPVAPDGRKSEFLLWTILSAAYAALIIQYTMRYGKLAAPPFYDDVSYFMDALARLREAYAHNWSFIIMSFLHRPPHSVFSTIIALISYLLFGTHDWAPYAGNTVIVLALAGILNMMARGLPLWTRLMLFLLVLTIPISQNAIIEFRPDIASALCAAAGAAMILSRPMTAGTWQQRIGAGALIGLSMIIKTPTFPLTGVVFATALGVSCVADLLTGKERPSIERLALLAVQPLLTAFVVVLPVYAPQFREIIDYIYQPIFGKTADMWTSHMTPHEHHFYYLTGEGGMNMLGKHVYLLLGIIAAGLILAAIRRRKFVLVMITGFVCATAISYAIPTLMKVKQPFFGTTFDWLLIFCAVYVLLWIVRSTPIALGGSVLTAVAAYAALSTNFIPKMYEPEGANLLARRRVIYGIYNALNDQKVSPRDRVYITTTGYVNAAVLDYLNMQKCLPQFNIQEQPFSGDLKVHRAEIEKARFVIASEQGNSESYGGFIPSGNIQDETLAIVRGDAEFAEVFAIPTLTPKRYFLFKRVGPFWGWTAVEGMGPSEGPYPAWKLGEVRWALGPRSILTLPEVKADGDYVITGSCKSAVASAKMAIRVDGHAIGAHAFSDDTTKFDSIQIPVHLSAGTHQLELTYTDWSKNPAMAMAVLFKTMQLVPASSLPATTQPADASAKQ